MQPFLSLLTSKKIKRKAYRDAYVRAGITSAIAHQIALIRSQRGLTQRELAELISSKQSVISRYEDASYGKLSVSTLVDIANAFDVGLEVKFVPFSRLIGERNNWSQEKAVTPSFEEELAHIENNLTEKVTYLYTESGFAVDGGVTYRQPSIETHFSEYAKAGAAL